jgi:hypothetical protein
VVDRQDADRCEDHRNVQPGYVSRGTLVVRFTSELVVRFGGAELRLRDGLVTGKLVKQPSGRYELQIGVITGRGLAEDLFRPAVRQVQRNRSAHLRGASGNGVRSSATVSRTRSQARR